MEGEGLVRVLFCVVVALLAGVARADGGDSAIGMVFGLGALFHDWKFLGAALAFPVAAVILVVVVRWRQRKRPGRQLDGSVSH